MAERRSRSNRFLPADPRVVEPYRLTPQLAVRLGVLGMLALGVFAVLFLRLWALQVLAGEQYLRAAQNNQLRTVRLEAPRGVILDRKGRILVGNAGGTALQLWPADLPEKGRYQMLQRLSRIIGVPADTMAAEVDKRANEPLNPATVKVGVPRAEAFYLSERRREFPGVVLATTYLRSYPHGTAAAHVLGHVGEINKDQLALREYRGVRAGDKVGQAGVEAAFDRYLRGQAGVAKLRVDSLGRPRSGLSTTNEPRAGNAVRLTIDIDLQRHAERALERGIELAHESECSGCWNARGGAIVALDARSGEVLAMASSPTYDPKIFGGRPDAKKLDPLVDDDVAEEENFPGLNRAIGVEYPPGSTFKPVTAIAALEEHLVRPYDPLLCSGSFTTHGQKFANWNPYVYVAMTMPTALAASCDTYFYQLGMRFYALETSPLQRWAERFGFGKPTGIEIGPEEQGLVPTPAWLKRTFEGEIAESWKPGDSVQLTIGQKDMLATPLQLARFYALVANGGRLVTPHLFRDVEGPGARSIVPHPTQPAPQRLDVSGSALQVIRRGLWEATHASYGTSTPVFGSFPIEIAGKTGTAEKWSDEHGRMFDQAWWCGYGPARAPRIVVCAVIENGGHGGSVAAPAARMVFERYFGLDVSDVGLVSRAETD